MISLGTSSLGIGLAIHLRDKFSARAAAISRQMRMMHGNAVRVQQENLRAMQALGAGMALGGALMTRGFIRSYKEYANFQHIVTSTAAILDLNNEKMREFSALSLKLGKQSVFSPEQVASAGEFLARQGFAYSQLERTLPAVIALGAATNTTISGKSGAADYMASIMHQFNKGPKDTQRIADVLAKTTLVSSSDLPDIYEALKHFSSTAMGLKISIEESLAMVATLSNAGLRGGMGGRSLNNMFLYLSNAATKFRTTRQSEAFSSIGIGLKDIVDSGGKLKPIIDIVTLFQNRLKNMPDVERVGALRALFNIRGARALEPLVRASELGLDFSEVLRQIRDDSKGVAGRIATKRMSDTWGLLERLKDTAKAFRIEVGQSLKPAFDFIVRGLTKMFDIGTKIVSHPLGRPFVILAAAGGVALLVAGALLATFTTIRLVSVYSSVTFANMGRTLAMAWNTGSAAALRYATTAKGATLVSTPFGARWRGANGKFVKGAKGASVMGVGGTGWLGKLGATMTNFIKNTGVLGWLFKGLGAAAKLLTGPIGWIGSILGVIVGFRNMIKLIVFGLGTLLNGLIFAGQTLWTFASNIVTPWKISGEMGKNKKRFMTAQENMKEQFGMKTMDDTRIGQAPPSTTTKGLETLIANSLATMDSTKGRAVQLWMSGKKVGEITQEAKAQELRSLFALPGN